MNITPIYIVDHVNGDMAYLEFNATAIYVVDHVNSDMASMLADLSEATLSKHPNNQSINQGDNHSVVHNSAFDTDNDCSLCVFTHLGDAPMNQVKTLHILVLLQYSDKPEL